MAKNSVLLICYGYPPNPGVGGRRWAKFSKYFLKEGIDVRVIRKKPEPDSKSNWNKDVQVLEKKGLVSSVHNPYPTILSKIPSSIPGKIHYRIALAYVKNAISGNPFDRSTLWKKGLLSEIENQIENGVETIIASAAPFRYLEHLIEMKKKHPYIQLIGDFRDPWVNNTIAYGFTNLSEKRRSYEEWVQQSVFENFDRFLCVDETHVQYINSKITSPKAFCIPNGFDPEDFAEISTNDSDSDKIRLVFAGSLYPKSDYIFSELVKELKQLNIDDPALFNRFQFDFYGSKPGKFDSYFADEDIKSVFKFHGRVSLQKAGEAIKNSTYAMLFLTEDLNYTRSTKFFEYIHLNKKIILFSKEGEMTDYIRNHKLGLAITPGNVRTCFQELATPSRPELTEKSTLDIEEHSIPFITKKLKELILTT